MLNETWYIFIKIWFSIFHFLFEENKREILRKLVINIANYFVLMFSNCILALGRHKKLEKILYNCFIYNYMSIIVYFFVDMGKDYYLWKLEKDFFINRTFSNLMLSFIIFPCMVMLFLANCPSPWKKQVLYMIKWGAIFALIETVMFLFGRITYHNGWNYWWSMAFDFTMPPMLRFHYVKPIPAWIVSFSSAAFYIIFFHVPLE